MKNESFDIIKKIKSQFKNDTRISFLGGAGVSTASGIPDFRSPEGIYNIESKYGVPYEVMLSHTYFMSHPSEFYDFYWSTMVNEKAKPNRAHYALAKMEASGKTVNVITQNIDGLHTEAGSKRVLELHGSTKRYHCSECYKSYSLSDIEHKGVPMCECGGIIKPDVVLYEESLDQAILEESVNCLRFCDILIVGGTSLNVYPAAGLIDYFGGRLSVLINKEKTSKDSFFDYCIHEDIGEVLEELAK